MIWELASLLLGAAIGWATSWVFERRSARSEHERHLETAMNLAQRLSGDTSDLMRVSLAHRPVIVRF